VLGAMGRPTSLADAFVIESLGMAARSAGFAVPGALGVQEAGFIMVCGLFAIPADIAIALSMVKRARELWVGIPGLMLWQWSEVQRLMRRHTIQRSVAGAGVSRTLGWSLRGPRISHWQVGSPPSPVTSGLMGWSSSGARTRTGSKHAVATDDRPVSTHRIFNRAAPGMFEESKCKDEKCALCAPRSAFELQCARASGRHPVNRLDSTEVETMTSPCAPRGSTAEGRLFRSIGSIGRDTDLQGRFR
jgi:hypothetical protein